MFRVVVRSIFAATALAGALVTAASANPFLPFAPVARPDVGPPPSYFQDDRFPRQYRSETETQTERPARFNRQVVDFPTREAPGTIIIDTPNTYLYLVTGNGRALRYGIGVGREGFTWAGTQTITRKAEWPDWHPPQEMIDRQPYLPRFMAGGPTNPLGARAMYLGSSVYRIHGTNAPGTIGTRVSSGCIRLVNEDVIDLFSRVNVGTKVIVLPMNHRADAGRAERFAAVQ